jgi:hypothetical protein
MSGGSADFRNVVLKDIAPWVEQNVKLDAQKERYGGIPMEAFLCLIACSMVVISAISLLQAHHFLGQMGA